MDAITRLKLKLGISLDDTSQDELLNVYLLDAEDAIKGFLNYHKDIETLDSVFVSSQIELARIYYLKAKNNVGVKAESYSEGSVSESTTYSSSAEYDAEASSVLDSLKRYRRVYVKHKEENSE